MKSSLLLPALMVGFVALTSVPGAHYAEAASTGAKTDAERKKTLNEQLQRIDQQAEREINRVLDGQKGLGNSGATQKKVAAIESQRDARKKALIDHYNQGRTGVVGLDGKLKNAGATSAPAAKAPATTGRVGLDGKLKPAPAAKAPHYVVGIDGKKKLVP